MEITLEIPGSYSRAWDWFCKTYERKGTVEEREVGIVKWFSDSKGYGFISRENGEDLFVHYTEITGEGFRTLDEGQRVEYSVEETEKGLQASNVTPL